MKLCENQHRVGDAVYFCPTCGSMSFTRDSSPTGSVGRWFLAKWMPRRDGSSEAFRQRHPGVVVTMRAVRFVGISWVLAGVVIVGTSFQHWQHLHVRGDLETNWLLAEGAATVVGAVIFAVAHSVLRLLRDAWESSSYPHASVEELHAGHRTAPK